ncbi:MAG: FAD-dependent oxidoreductase [Alphaproteobacteria bacterium]|nr:FAD-dependent oxidoreductase [Alphaproteobacteria bacterium]
MRVAVLGGGVVGVAAAWYLAKAGAEVTVVERNDQAAAECSFAPTGQLAPGHCGAWASPRAPGILLRSLLDSDAALRLRLHALPGLWRWGLAFLRECTEERYRRNSLIKLRLCLDSVASLRQLRTELDIRYDHNDNGALFLHRDPAHLESAARDIDALAAHGLKLEVHDAAGAARIDPSLAPVAGKLAGALYSPVDGSGDCAAFTRALAGHSAALGVAFRYGSAVERIEAEGDRITRVVTSSGPVDAEAYVLSLGVESPRLMGPLGVHLPIYPVKGYSVTFPVRPGGAAPRMALVDEHNLVGIARLGDRVRFAGKAVFTGYDTRIVPEMFGGMRKVARDLFPDGIDESKPSYWACLRPMTPDGPPILGIGRHKNLFFNTGHGHVGWTMACGSGRAIADMVFEKKPSIDLDGLTLAGREL